MAFPDKNFTFDIFISYSHEDNLSALPNSPGWVETFATALEYGLRNLSVRPRIWWDANLYAGKLFDLTIQNTIDSSILFICLNSANYTRSQYCKDELDHFFKKCKTERIGVKFRDNSRVFNILLSDVEQSRWKPELTEVHTMEFFQKNREFPLNPMAEEFTKKIQELASATNRIMWDFSKEWKNREEKPVIFVAEVNHSLRPQKKKLIQTLDYLSYPVVTSIPPPYKSQEHKQEVTENLEYCELSIHMFNQHHTGEIEGDSGNFYCTTQLALASSMGIDQLVWRSKNTADIEDVRYKSVLDELEKGTRVNPKLQFIRTYESDFINRIVPDKIGLFAEGRKVVANPNALFLDCHPKVLQTGETLSSVAAQNGFDAMLCANPEEMEKSLYKVSFVTFVFGEPVSDWIARHLEIVLKHKNRKIRELSVFSHEKRKGFSKELGLHQFIQINEFTDFESYGCYLNTLKASM